MNIAELLDQNPKPDDVALIDRSQTPVREVSVAEITEQVHVFAQALMDLGLPPGSRIGLLAGNLGEYYTVMFGAPAAGMVFVPLNTRLPESTLLYIIDDADLKFLVTDDQHAELEAGVPKVAIGSSQWDQMMAGTGCCYSDLHVRFYGKSEGRFVVTREHHIYGSRIRGRSARRSDAGFSTSVPQERLNGIETRFRQRRESGSTPSVFACRISPSHH